MTETSKAAEQAELDRIENERRWARASAAKAAEQDAAELAHAKKLAAGSALSGSP